MVRSFRDTRASRSIVGLRSILGLGGGLAVLIIVAASSAWQAERNASVLEQTSRTQALRTLVADILISAQNAETGQRGYLLTLNNDYLTPFYAAKRELPAQIVRLQNDLPNHPQFAAIRDAGLGKLAELQRTVDLAGSGHVDEAIAVVRTNEGREAMGRIRAAVTAMEKDLDAELVTDADSIRAGGRALVVIDVFGLLLVIALSSLIAVGIRAYLADLAAARQAASDAYHALEANNDRLDEAVRHRTADLTAANEEIQRFAYIVSHDLRAPLVNIMGFTSELEHATGILAGYTAAADLPGDVREAAVEEIPEALRFIKASTSKMDRLINAILKLSREGRRVLTAERLDMHAMFETLVETMGHQAAAVDISIAEDVPGILADRVATEQVFGNIIDNALKYLDPDRPGRIRVTGGIEGGMARYDISDNGRGIAERDFERVFELFRRAGNQTVPGEGIGLAHVRALVRRMGGSIDCSSRVGVGTVFSVRLPVVGQYA